MKKKYIKPTTDYVVVNGKRLCIIDWGEDVPIGTSGETTTPEESDSKETEFDMDDSWGNLWEEH